MSQRPPKPQHWQQWTEREARDVLARLDRSELSIAAFARSLGVSIDRIRYWRARLAATPQPAAAPAPAPFIAVRVRSAHTIKITLAALCIELAADTDAERLADIVAALAKRQLPC
jgi:hypothetical protein